MHPSSEGLVRRGEQLTHNLSVRCSLLLADSLCIDLKRGLHIRVPQELLLHLDVSTVRSQKCRVGVSQHVPADALRDLCSNGCTLDESLQQVVGPVRLLSVLHLAGEQPVRICRVWSLAAPVVENCDDFFSERHWLPTFFGLGIPNVAVNNPSLNS